MKKVRNILGISGGKDSAALAIYLKRKHPDLEMEYYFCDTGKELPETYTLITNLEVFLGKKVTRLEAVADSHMSPFDHFVKYKGRFLPSTFNRWCTKNLKLDPFEKWIGDEKVISYVGIRGDEDREGYISKKGNVQSIFPFKRNMWSEEVISKLLKNSNITFLLENYSKFTEQEKLGRVLGVVGEMVSPKFNLQDKLDALLNLGVKTFNQVMFEYLKTTSYAVGQLDSYSLVSNDDNLIRDDIFKILKDSGVGVPKYYQELEFEINGKTGLYSRSRSGCFFCFYQQKIEWVWLYEQHPALFKEAMQYERNGYSWADDESLEELSQPRRIQQIKEEYMIRQSLKKNKSAFLLDILEESEEEGCAACFL